MTFKVRALKIRFATKTGEINGQQGGIVDLAGYRAEAIVTNPGGGLAVGQLQMRIFGMKLSDMNAFSTDGLNALAVRGDMVTVSAGDLGGKIQQVFEGTIFAAYIDFSASPEISFNVSATTGYIDKIKPTSPNSYKGSVNVADTIKALAEPLGYTVKNNGVTATLSNPYLSGSAMDQIMSLIDQSGIAWALENAELAIWPSEGYRDDRVVAVGPTTGMIGYPTFTSNGIQVRAEYNPEVGIGRRVQVSSVIPKACGTWCAAKVDHELSTLQPGGAWYTTLQLVNQGYYVSRL